MTTNEQSLETSLVTVSNAIDLAAQVILRMSDSTITEGTTQATVDNLRALAAARLQHTLQIKPLAPATID